MKNNVIIGLSLLLLGSLYFNFVFLRKADSLETTLTTNTEAYQVIEREKESLKKDIEVERIYLVEQERITQVALVEIDTLKKKLKAAHAVNSSVGQNINDSSSTEDLLDFIASQKQELEIQEAIIANQDKVITDKDNYIAAQDVIIHKQDEIIAKQEEQIDMFVKKEKELPKILKREKWKGRLQGFGFGLLSGGLWLLK